MAMLGWAGWMWILAACGRASVDCDPAEMQLSGDDTLASGGEEVPPQPMLKDFGPSGWRVTLMVLPGDAEVEVGGVAVRRRDGVIELTGKVGETQRLRVFKGADNIERDVILQTAGASPPVLDLMAELVKQRGAPGGAKGVASAAPAADTLLPEEFE
jgi:hypothetical protein